MPCYMCMRLLPGDAFDETQPGPHWWHRLNYLDRRSRTCVRCLLARRCMRPGTRFKRDGISAVLCASCLKIRVADPAPNSPYSDLCIICAMCRALRIIVTDQSIQRRAIAWITSPAQIVSGVVVFPYAARTLREAALVLHIGDQRMVILSFCWVRHLLPHQDLR